MAKKPKPPEQPGATTQPPKQKARTVLRTIPFEWKIALLATLVGIVGDLLYAISIHPRLGTFASALLFSLAALVAGGFFGFLFGLPHVDTNAAGQAAQPAASGPTPSGAATAATGSPAATSQTAGGAGSSPLATPATDPATPGSGVSLSTNLQQVADWLTKLLLGAGLTQLGRFPHGAYVLFHGMAAALSGSTTVSGEAVAVAGAIASYFAIAGFVLGWLSTYLFLTPAVDKLARAAAGLVQQSVALATQAGVAELAGNADKATRLQARAETQRKTAAALNRALALPPEDATRYRDLDQVALEAAVQELAARPTTDLLRSKYQAGDAHEKSVVLAAMTLDSTTAAADVIVNSISSSATAVEQYWALRAAFGVAGSVQGADADSLRTAVAKEMDSFQHFSRQSARYTLAKQILQLLPPPPAPPAAPE